VVEKAVILAVGLLLLLAASRVWRIGTAAPQ
jgi:hypothetical protein